MMNKIFYYRMCAALQAVMLKSLTRDTVPAKQGRSEIRGCTTASSENSCPPCAYRLSVLPYKNTSSQHRISFTISSGRRDCENLKYPPPNTKMPSADVRGMPYKIMMTIINQLVFWPCHCRVCFARRSAFGICCRPHITFIHTPKYKQVLSECDLSPTL